MSVRIIPNWKTFSFDPSISEKNAWARRFLLLMSLNCIKAYQNFQLCWVSLKEWFLIVEKKLFELMYFAGSNCSKMKACRKKITLGNENSNNSITVLTTPIVLCFLSKHIWSDSMKSQVQQINLFPFLAGRIDSFNNNNNNLFWFLKY